MVFRRAVQRYGHTPLPVTPYARAGQVWDDRIGSARVQARNWRLMAFCSLGLAIGMAGAFVWQSRESRVVPYVIEVDRLGEPRALSEAEKAHRPTDPQIAWHLAAFIGNVRSVSMDPVLMRRDWLSAYDFVTPKGALFIGEYARASDPFARVGEESVSVQVTSVVRASDRSFQVKWTESVYARGSLADTSQWTAILAIETRVPETADTLRKNPLGIYVDAIAWSRELEPASARAPAPRRNAASQSPAIEELQP
ncbi:conjugal transfer protein TrbF [Sandaracinobacteroides hominis]|uniref:conjugal transfer protein TrbF n=1 Tax=Sandaracinobacteroides hominis TaxID=2780086 RepID=UPI0018F6E60B|nr:conjugal transfer protein TrbF [Sandaracinobacteroides hominis]